MTPETRGKALALARTLLSLPGPHAPEYEETDYQLESTIRACCVAHSYMPDGSIGYQATARLAWIELARKA